MNCINYNLSSNFVEIQFLTFRSHHCYLSLVHTRQASYRRKSSIHHPFESCRQSLQSAHLCSDRTPMTRNFIKPASLRLLLHHFHPQRLRSCLPPFHLCLPLHLATPSFNCQPASSHTTTTPITFHGYPSAPSETSAQVCTLILSALLPDSALTLTPGLAMGLMGPAPRPCPPACSYHYQFTVPRSSIMGR